MPTITDLIGPAGSLEALLDGPEPPSSEGRPVRAAVVFAHPHPQFGGTMHTKVVYQGAKGLARIGCAVLRFNFRGVGRSERSLRSGRGEKEDFKAALDYMASRYPGSPLWAAGFSFGSWVASRLARPTIVFPRSSGSRRLSRRRSPGTTTPENTSPAPSRNFAGEADEVCPIEGMWTFYGKLEEPKELVVIDGADHLFEGRPKTLARPWKTCSATFPSLNHE
jgi:alpha/beta superfamily hydrolase